MIFASALCFVLVVASSMADQAEDERLAFVIVSKIAAGITDAANSNRDLDPQQLTTVILNRINTDLKQLGPELHQLYTSYKQRHGSATSLASDLTLKINQNKAVNDALARNNRYQPRFVGALVLGITQIITDVVKMGLTRY